jgi:ParB family chromosome partitioning protein
LPLDQQIRWADEVIRHKLTVRMLERKIAVARDGKIVFRPAKPGDWKALEREISDLLGCSASVSADKQGKGELRVKFHSLDELDGVLAKIGYSAR